MRYAARLALVVFQAVWLNVIVPGHTRGAVALPGSGGACHEERSAKCCGSGEKQGGKKSPTPGDRERCAVCFFAARLTTAPPVTFAPGPTGLAGVLPVPQGERGVSPEYVTTYLGRGPPGA